MNEYFILSKGLKDSKGKFWHRVLIADSDLKKIKEKYFVKELKDIKVEK